jgi:hypothetical protein
MTSRLFLAMVITDNRSIFAGTPPERTGPEQKTTAANAAVSKRPAIPVAANRRISP